MQSHPQIKRRHTDNFALNSISQFP
ncbi:hypothetical protein CO2235_200078 [Cupriavidus oxalaticus]|uniref:Uncharacterized protein n=1 Tax=Cupriavidus oxalaticus TaxID=96344 RepID=A0A976BCU0_9BURK|nr:hypothetical protein CO2235_200078 [Cupriavidus oxalaticus]